MIYTLALIPPHPQEIILSDGEPRQAIVPSPPHRNPLGLPLVNRHISKEALKIVYTKTTFAFSHSSSLDGDDAVRDTISAFLRRIGRQNAARICQIHVGLDMVTPGLTRDVMRLLRAVGTVRGLRRLAPPWCSLVLRFEACGGLLALGLELRDAEALEASFGRCLAMVQGLGSRQLQMGEMAAGRMERWEDMLGRVREAYVRGG